MFRQFRRILPGEFIIAGGDCSQGGKDYNCTQFLSVTYLDVPLIYHSRGVATTMTSAIYPVLERIADITKVKPLVGLERSMGGASEMERLQILNRHEKYKIFTMPTVGNQTQIESNQLGINMNALTRPVIVGGLKQVIDIHGIGIHDRVTIDELSIFIENPSGKPEAAPGGHDDTVMSLGVGWFMRQYAEETPLTHKQDTGTVVTKVYDDPYS